LREAMISPSSLLAFFDEGGVVRPGRNNGRCNYHTDERKSDKQIMHDFFFSE
jgi:hypothetical protein